MRKKYLIGVIAVLILVLAVWLVPMALAAGSSPAPDQSPAGPPPSQGSVSAADCPYLQAQQCPYLDPDGAASSSSYQTWYY